MKALFKLSVAVLLAGCGASFDPGSRVTTTRILSVVADKPFAAPGEAVSISALGLDPKGRTITWAWATCANPRASSAFACFGKIAEDAAKGVPPTFAVGAGKSTFDFTVPTDALSSISEVARPAAFVGVVTVACPGTLTFATSPSSPTTQGLPFTCSDGGRALPLEEFEVSVKRVFVRGKDRNQNPVISEIRWNGQSWPESEIRDVHACDDATTNDYSKCDGDKPEIAAIVSPASFEKGTDEYGASFEEQVVVQHYSTEGLFEAEVRRADSPKTHFVARAGARGSEVTLWFVAHDNRGGQSWVARKVRVN